MNAYQLYEAAFDSALDHVENTIEYIQKYAENAYEEMYVVSDELAQKILDCKKSFEDSEKGSNNYYHMIQAELEDIKL